MWVICMAKHTCVWPDPFPYFCWVGPGDEATIKVLAQSSQQSGKGNKTIKLTAKTKPFLVAPCTSFSTAKFGPDRTTYGRKTIFRVGELLWLTQKVQGCGVCSGSPQLTMASTCAFASTSTTSMSNIRILTDSSMLISRLAVPERQMHFEHHNYQQYSNLSVTEFDPLPQHQQ